MLKQLLIQELNQERFLPVDIESTSLNILIIDDDPEDVELFCEIIREVAPDSVCNAIYACTKLHLALTSFGEPDVIFLDGNMSPVTSQECLSQLIKITDSKKTRIIIHTGSISEREEAEFLLIGAGAILYKAPTAGDLRTNFTKAIFPERTQ